MGGKYRTILNLEVVKSDLENDLIYIKGSIPGSKNSIIFLRKSTKSINRKTSIEKYAQESKETSKKDTKKIPEAKKNTSKTNENKTTQKVEKKK